MPNDVASWTVLLIDDEPDSLDLVHDILTLHGAQVIRAANGKTGLELLETVQPTLVILDLNMPAPDGWAVLHWIRSNPALASTPVVAITAYYSESVEQHAIDAGFDVFISKPIKSSHFMQYLHDVFD